MKNCVPLIKRMTTKILQAIFLLCSALIDTSGSSTMKYAHERHDPSAHANGTTPEAIQEAFENATLPPASIQAMHKLLEALQRVKENLEYLQPLGDQLGQIYDTINGSSGTPLDTRPWVTYQSKDRQLIKKTFGYRVTVYASPGNNDSKPNVTEEIFLTDDSDEDKGDLESAASDHTHPRVVRLLPSSSNIRYIRGDDLNNKGGSSTSLFTAHEGQSGHKDVNTFKDGHYDQTESVSQREKARHSKEHGSRIRNHNSGASSHDEHAHDKGGAKERAFREKTHIEYFEKEHFLDAAYNKAEKAHDRHRSLTELEAHNQRNRERQKKQQAESEKLAEIVDHPVDILRVSHHGDEDSDSTADDTRRIEHLEKALKDHQNNNKTDKNDKTSDKVAAGQKNTRNGSSQTFPGDLQRLGSKPVEVKHKTIQAKDDNRDQGDILDAGGNEKHEVYHHDTYSNRGSEKDSQGKRAHHREEGDKAFSDAAKGHRKQGYRERGFKIMTEVELIDRGVHHDTGYGRRDRAKSLSHREREKHGQQEGEEKKNFEKEQKLHKDYEDIKHVHDGYKKNKDYDGLDNSNTHSKKSYNRYYYGPSGEKHQGSYVPTLYASSSGAKATKTFKDQQHPKGSEELTSVTYTKHPLKSEYKLKKLPINYETRVNDVYERLNNFYNTQASKTQQESASRRPQSEEQVVEVFVPEDETTPVGVDSFIRDVVKDKLLKSVQGNYFLTTTPPKYLTLPMKRPPLRYIDNDSTQDGVYVPKPWQTSSHSPIRFNLQDAKPPTVNGPYFDQPTQVARPPINEGIPLVPAVQQPPRYDIPSHIIIHSQPRGHPKEHPRNRPRDKTVPLQSAVHQIKKSPLSYLPVVGNVPEDGTVLIIHENNLIRRMGLQPNDTSTQTSTQEKYDTSKPTRNRIRNRFGERIARKIQK